MRTFVKDHFRKALVAAYFLLALWYLAFSDSGLYKVHRLEQEKARLDQDIVALEREIGDLTWRTERLRTSDAAIEQEIRQSLGMVHAEETVFLFTPAREVDPGTS
ncbi:septum formation initiator family protein [bacterium]|nr:septum formation initiator family protein [bacterium]